MQAPEQSFTKKINHPSLLLSPAAGNPVNLYLRRAVPPGQLYGQYVTAAINPVSWATTGTVAVTLLPRDLQPGECGGSC